MALGVGEPGADIGGGLDVDNASAGPVGTEDREAVAIVSHHLGVHARSAGGETPDQLADQSLPLQLPHIGDNGQLGVEVQQEGVLVDFDDQTLKTHIFASARHAKT